MNLITLEQFRRHLGFPAELPDDPRLQDVMRAAHHIITQATQRHFIPYRATETLTAHPRDERLIVTSPNLLELITLSDETGAVDLNAVTSVSGHIERTDGLIFTGKVTLTAIYGDHEEPASAWLSVTALADTVSTGQTTITVDDVTAVDALTGQALFDAGQLLRIGDEFMRLDASHSATNTLTVTRGVRGTDATEHAIGATVSVYVPPADAVNLCLRVATLLYRDPDISSKDVLGAVRRDLANRRQPRVV